MWTSIYCLRQSDESDWEITVTNNIQVTLKGCLGKLCPLVYKMTRQLTEQFRLLQPKWQWNIFLWLINSVFVLFNLKDAKSFRISTVGLVD